MNANIVRPDVAAHLQAAGLVNMAGLQRGREVSVAAAIPLEVALNRIGLLADEALVAVYAKLSDSPRWRPDEKPARAFEEPMSASFYRDRAVVPLGHDGSHAEIAVIDPFDHESAEAVTFATGRPTRRYLATSAECRAALDALFPASLDDGARNSNRLSSDLDTLADADRDGPAARLLNDVLARAAAQNASDIHFEPRRDELRIRLRVDGVLRPIDSAPADLGPAIVGRIKVVAELDLGERRLPQDGRCTLVAGGQPIDARISVVPTTHGESAVLRLLNRAAVPLNFDALGFAERERASLRHVLTEHHGVFLVAGPTGSGKTTTLYAMLQALSGSQRKILTIEDPIEYEFDHVSQTQANAQIGLTFAAALRAFLRQDPDVMLVGEIRDRETAQIAMQAAMTGHLVLASLHANDAIRAVPRLLDMGVEPYQLAAAFSGALAQRLAPRACPRCARRIDPPAHACSALGLAAGAQAVEAIGCVSCNGTGRKGRIVVAESFSCDDALSEAIVQRVPVERLRAAASERGYRPLVADLAAKVEAGVVALDDALSIAGASE